MAASRNKPGQDPTQKSRRPWKLWLLATAGCLAVLAMAVWAVLHGVFSLSDLLALQDRWAALRPVFLVWRLGLITAVIAGYPYWVKLLARRQGWPPAQQAAALQLRWTLAGWLVLMELLIGQHGMAALVQWLIIGQD